MGHRNWVVVADSAYPLQTAPELTSIVDRTGARAIVGLDVKLSAVCECVRQNPQLIFIVASLASHLAMP